MGTFIGMDPSKTIEEKIKEAVPIFSDLVSYARDRSVKLMIENCPMIGWQMEGLVGNVFFTPSIWEDFFNSILDDYFSMNFDPPIFCARIQMLLLLYERFGIFQKFVSSVNQYVQFCFLHFKTP